MALSETTKGLHILNDARRDAEQVETEAFDAWGATKFEDAELAATYRKLGYKVDQAYRAIFEYEKVNGLL